MHCLLSVNNITSNISHFTQAYQQTKCKLDYFAYTFHKPNIQQTSKFHNYHTGKYPNLDIKPQNPAPTLNQFFLTFSINCPTFPIWAFLKILKTQSENPKPNKETLKTHYKKLTKRTHKSLNHQHQSQNQAKQDKPIKALKS